MRIRDSFRSAYLGIKHAKMRSALTMLGIVIGIASVILLMSIGSSAQALIINQVQSAGSNLVFVIPGATKSSRQSPPTTMGIIIKTLVRADEEALRRDPVVVRVSPEVRGQARAVSDQDDLAVTYYGANVDYFTIRNLDIGQGYAFSRADVDSFNKVAVIGKDLAVTLFGQRNPVGKTFRLKDITFRVVGVLAKSGTGPMGIDMGNLVIVPLTVGQKQMVGINYYQSLAIEASGDYTPEFIKARITSILRQSHNITNPDKDDFTIYTQQDILDTLSSITTILNIFLTAIASISLVVGGIGIMNIMLVSVVERTREIGLRKAVGATNRDIMQQFLVESVVLTFVGGIIGIACGALLVTVVYFVLIYFTTIGWVFSLPASAIILAVLVATFTGVIFGLYPARQAARKNPIDALRYE
ncbi:MAG: ABC transporter permease [bacterium]